MGNGWGGKFPDSELHPDSEWKKEKKTIIKDFITELFPISWFGTITLAIIFFKKDWAAIDEPAVRNWTIFFSLLIFSLGSFLLHLLAMLTYLTVIKIKLRKSKFKNISK